MQRKGKRTMVLGLILSLSPFVAYLLKTAFPLMISKDTALVGFLVSAFGVIICVPAGIVIFLVGVFRWFGSREQD